jgi:hypothetical protein
MDWTLTLTEIGGPIFANKLMALYLHIYELKNLSAARLSRAVLKI